MHYSDRVLMLGAQVDLLSQEMVDLIERLNRSTEEKSSADDTVAKVEKILNEQYKTLHWGKLTQPSAVSHIIHDTQQP